MTDSALFQELYQQWRKVKNPHRKARMGRVLLNAKLCQAEIDVYRRARSELRVGDTLRPELDGTLLTGEMHALEHEACRLLCPQLEIGRGSAKTKGWEWVMRQPWAAELKPPQMAKRFH